MEKAAGRQGPPEMALRPRESPDCDGWGARPARLAASIPPISPNSGISIAARVEMRASHAGHRGQSAAIAFGFDRPASVFEQPDHLPAGVENQRIEGLLEAGLLDRDRFGQLPPPCRQRLETRLSGVPERSLGTVSLTDLERMVA